MFWRCLMIDSSYLSKLSFTVIWAWYFLQGCAARNVHGFTQEDIEKMSKQWEEASSLYLQLDVKVCCKFGVIWLKVLAWSSHNNSSANCIIMSSYWCLHCFSFTYLTVIISWRWSKGKQNTGGNCNVCTYLSLKPFVCNLSVNFKCYSSFWSELKTKFYREKREEVQPR